MTWVQPDELGLSCTPGARIKLRCDYIWSDSPLGLRVMQWELIIPIRLGQGKTSAAENRPVVPPEGGAWPGRKEKKAKGEPPTPPPPRQKNVLGNFPTRKDLFI